MSTDVFTIALIFWLCSISFAFGCVIALKTDYRFSLLFLAFLLGILVYKFAPSYTFSAIIYLFAFSLGLICAAVYENLKLIEQMGKELEEEMKS